MKILNVFKFQMCMYLFIILFTIQNAAFLLFNSKFSVYKYIVELVFIFSVLIVFISVLLLIIQAVKTINQKKIVLKEIVFLILNIILYYFVIISSIILSTQFPHLPDSF